MSVSSTTDVWRTNFNWNKELRIRGSSKCVNQSFALIKTRLSTNRNTTQQEDEINDQSVDCCVGRLNWEFGSYTRSKRYRYV